MEAALTQDQRLVGRILGGVYLRGGLTQEAGTNARNITGRVGAYSYPAQALLQHPGLVTNIPLTARVLGLSSPAQALLVTNEDVVSPNDFDILFVQNNGTTSSTPPTLMAPAHLPVTLITDANAIPALTNAEPYKSHITWNFGDTTSPLIVRDPDAATPCGLRVAQHDSNVNLATSNRIFGFNAAYLYETNGTYTVSCSVTLAGGTNRTSSTSVTVAADTRTTNTVGTNASDDFSTIAAAVNAVSNDTYILFRRGGSVIDAVATYSFAGHTNVIVGAFGTGADPVINMPGDAVAGIALGQTVFDCPANSSRIGFRDLHFTATTNAIAGTNQTHSYDSGANSARWFTWAGHAHWCYSIMQEGEQGSNPCPGRLLSYESAAGGSLLDMRVHIDSNRAGHYTQNIVVSTDARNFCTIGGSIGSSADEFLSRFAGLPGTDDPNTGVNLCLVYYSMYPYVQQSPTKGLRFQYMDFVSVTQNVLLGCSTGTGFDGRDAQHIIFDANYITDATGDNSPTGHSADCMFITRRNNIIEGFHVEETEALMTGGGASNAGGVVDFDGIESNIFLPNNTWIHWPVIDGAPPDPTGPPFDLRGMADMNAATISNHEFKNNLVCLHSNHGTAVFDFLGAKPQVGNWTSGGNVFPTAAHYRTDRFQREGGTDRTFAAWQSAMTNGATNDAQEDYDVETLGPVNAYAVTNASSVAATNGIPIDGVHHDYRLVDRNLTATNWYAGAISGD